MSWIKVPYYDVDVYLSVEKTNSDLMEQIVWFFHGIKDSSPHAMSPPKGGYKLIQYEFKSQRRQQQLVAVLEQYDESVVLYEASERIKDEWAKPTSKAA